MNRLETIGTSILLIWNLMITTLAVRYSIIATAGVAIDAMMQHNFRRGIYFI
jgi:hypothetical protein